MKPMHLVHLSILIALIIGIFLWRFPFYNSAQSEQRDAVIIVGTNTEYPPYSFMEHDTIVGLDIDVIREVGKRLNKAIDLHDMPFEALIPEIQLGKIQVIAAGMTPTEQRAKRVLFTKPHFEGDPLVIVSLATNPLTSIDALKHKNVVVNQGFTADTYMSDKPDINLTRVPALAESFLALKKGRADAFITAQNTVQPFFNYYDKKDFVVTVIPDTGDSVALGISKKYPELLPEIQQALDAMEQDGTLTNLKKKWSQQ